MFSNSKVCLFTWVTHLNRAIYYLKGVPKYHNVPYQIILVNFVKISLYECDV